MGVATKKKPGTEKVLVGTRLVCAGPCQNGFAYGMKVVCASKMLSGCRLECVCLCVYIECDPLH